MSNYEHETITWKQTPLFWGLLTTSILFTLFIFNEGLKYLLEIWNTREEYSHGYLIPFVVIFLIWQKKEILQGIKFEGSWAGLAVVFLGLVLFFSGELSTLYVIVQYSFLIVLTGIVLSLLGWKGFRVIWVPLLILIFMIPLPNFILQNLSNELQLISSQMGVWIIKAFGISVLLEGNVIDLGKYKLQVVEACSGLRYLFPLMTFGFITAYFYKAEMWKRIMIFLSTIPITVLMNSFRIGVIGVTVEYWGESMANGFLHDFEGWFVFMACTGLLFVEMWLLTRIGKNRKSLTQVFAIHLPVKNASEINALPRTIPTSYLVVASMLLLVTIAGIFLPERQEIIPGRKQFSSFPLTLDRWHGQEDHLKKIYLETLKLEDYILADYLNVENQSVNFYVAYYDSQRKGESAHSPRTCIPGGGWKIESLSDKSIPEVIVNGNPLRVNRTLISMGDHKQLVYYWFQQRGRVITNEYMVKWYLFWDALKKNRTDGALVRLTTYIKPGQDIAEADRLLIDFAKSVNPLMKKFIPI